MNPGRKQGYIQMQAFERHVIRLFEKEKILDIEYHESAPSFHRRTGRRMPAGLHVSLIISIISIPWAEKTPETRPPGAAPCQRGRNLLRKNRVQGHHCRPGNKNC